LVANVLFTAHVSWALFPLGIFAFGWAQAGQTCVKNIL